MKKPRPRPRGNPVSGGLRQHRPDPWDCRLRTDRRRGWNRQAWGRPLRAPRRLGWDDAGRSDRGRDQGDYPRPTRHERPDPLCGAPSTNGGAIATTRSPSTDRSPLTVGMLVTTASGLDSTGYSLGNTVNEQARRQGPRHAPSTPRVVSPDTSSSGSTPRQTPSARAGRATSPLPARPSPMTTRSKAVLGYSFNYYASFESCLAKKGIPHLSSSFNIPNRKELSRFPAFVAVDVPTVERRGLAKVDGALATGYLTARTNSASWPTTARVVRTPSTTSCSRSSSELAFQHPRSRSSAASTATPTPATPALELSNAELAFASAGIDRVMIHGVSEGPSMAQFT